MNSKVFFFNSDKGPNFVRLEAFIIFYPTRKLKHRWVHNGDLFGVNRFSNSTLCWRIKPCRWCFLLQICTIFMSFWMQELMQQMCIRSLKNIMLHLLWMMLSFPGFFIGEFSGISQFHAISVVQIWWGFIGGMRNVAQCGHGIFVIFVRIQTYFAWHFTSYTHTHTISIIYRIP